MSVGQVDSSQNDNHRYDFSSDDDSSSDQESECDSGMHVFKGIVSDSVNVKGNANLFTESGSNQEVTAIESSKVDIRGSLQGHAESAGTEGSSVATVFRASDTGLDFNAYGETVSLSSRASGAPGNCATVFDLTGKCSINIPNARNQE